MDATNFWAQIVQLIAVLALALVIEVRAMYQRVQAIDKSRSRGARIAIAVMYALAVIGLAFSFLTGLSGMTGASISDGRTKLALYALIFTFLLLVVAPTTPLIWALVDDLPISPDGVRRWKLGRLRGQVDEAFRQADRAARTARLESMGEASGRVVEAIRTEPTVNDGGTSPVDDALEGFTLASLPSSGLSEARAEIDSLLIVLADGNDLTSAEVKRWRAAARIVRAAGGRSMP
ncbi:hypothetical protein QF046_002950 [Microbacterium sp. W4I4]|uniref:hypothetical protein n=1 Tax=Microbacterium sp. W4I4 TaxID=3042295 RepID=UPI0027873C35|nr:hypothetical protein [Microbacterium sp. W4I4]MDQ0615309.1 hypothetical protein [Microbacterium sp. W4I4]